MIGGGAATTKLVEQLTRAIGAPVATPAVISVGNGEVDRARYRVFRWRCPACGGGRDDPIYRPLVVDTDGRVWCEAPGCPVEQHAVTLRGIVGSSA
jgi:hypothetical protein